MEILTTIDQLNQLKASERTVFMFTTTWCGDCTYIKPFIPSIEAHFPDFTIVEVDRDQFMDFAQELGVMGIPSFVVYHQNEKFGDFISADRKTQEEIEAFLTEINQKLSK